ncbi:MAG: PstS family phosphate ABC transporter substrate-binding protein [Chloroflexia bacterium]|nr:PstS family phosphate ABC transporter substrate-binding protein [Chloroflexia bacterium]
MRWAPRDRVRQLLLLLGLGIVLLLAPASATLAQHATPAAGVLPSAGVDLTQLSGTIVADGSSTVWPITAEAADRFMGMASVIVEVEISGTGGGFRRFCVGESDLQNASREITDEERAACAASGVTYEVFPLGFDGVTVAVHPSNTWAQCLSVEQLRAIWEPERPEGVWKDVDPAWPNEKIELYGPGPDSGTFDYFTEEIVGEAGLSRTDYIPSENDLDLVEGVASQRNALGYFGYAYYAENADRLHPVAIDSGAGCVLPSPETIADGSYAPLSRPLFLYVNRERLTRPEVREFVRFTLDQSNDIVDTVGYVPMEATIYADNRARLEAALAAPTA